MTRPTRPAGGYWKDGSDAVGAVPLYPGLNVRDGVTLNYVDSAMDYAEGLAAAAGQASQAVTNITSGPYTVSAVDANKLLRINSASAVDLLVAANSLAVGDALNIMQAGAGAVTIDAGGTYQRAVLPDSPYLYWRLDGDATDRSPNGRNGTATSASYVTGLLTAGGQALQASSATSIVSAALNAGVPCSVECIYSPSARDIAAADVHILGKTGSGSNKAIPAPLTLGLASGHLRVTIGNGGAFNYRIYDGSAPLVAGTTYHLAVTLSGATIATAPLAYINGSSVSLTQFYDAGATSWGDAAQPIVLGLRSDAGAYTTGVIDDAAWYASALSSTRVAAHAAAITTAAISLVSENKTGPRTTTGPGAFATVVKTAASEYSIIGSLVPA